MNSGRPVLAGLLAGVGALAAAWIPAQAGAEPAWTGTLALTSDYIFRGVSQTYGGPALQAGVNYQSPKGWFAGTWLSNVDPYPFGSHAEEIDLYAGYGWAIDPQWSARASYTRYLTVRDRRRKPYDYGEFALSLGYQDRLGATISYQPDSTRNSTQGYVRQKPSLAYELAGRWPLAGPVDLVGSAGYYDLTHLYGVHYVAGGLGLGYTRRSFSLDVMRFFSNRTVSDLFDDASADGRWSVTLLYRF